MEYSDYNKNYYNAYQQASDTVDEVQQIVILYDGAINFIKQAKEAIAEKNYEKRYNLINKAIAIVTGLNSCLNFTDETAETAKALDEFYSMIDMRLLYIQCDDNPESYDKVTEDLRIMRNAWSDIAKQINDEKAQKLADEALDARKELIIAGKIERETLVTPHLNLPLSEGQGDFQIIA